jgi:hypothetical protein
MKRSAVLSIAVSLAFAPAAFAQHRLEFEFGVRAGIPITKLLESNSFPPPPGFTFQESFEKPRYTIGPSFGAVLFDRVLVQFDALYKPIRSVTNDTTPAASFTTTARAASWEFPLVFDYLFLNRAVRPFVGGGMVAGQTVGGTAKTQGAFTTTGIPIVSETQYYADTAQFPAYVANAGIEWNKSAVVIRPELRYTRWDETLGSPKRKLDQFEFLLGFSLRPLR